MWWLNEVVNIKFLIQHVSTTILTSIMAFSIVGLSVPTVDGELLVVNDCVVFISLFQMSVVLCLGHSGHSVNVCGINEISQTGKSVHHKTKPLWRPPLTLCMLEAWQQEWIERVVFFICIYINVMHPFRIMERPTDHMSFRDSVMHLLCVLTVRTALVWGSFHFASFLLRHFRKLNCVLSVK